MSVFVDTSGMLAFLNQKDPRHRDAVQTLASLADVDDVVTSNYVVVEATALTQRRHGVKGTRALTDILSVIDTVWVRPTQHAAALAALNASSGRVSFVDRVSFEVMRGSGIETAFAFDRDFRTNGFKTIP